MTLFQRIKKEGIQYHNHYSDLYIPSTPKTQAILKEMGIRSQYFINQVEGGVWLDIFGAFDPYWEARQ